MNSIKRLLRRLLPGQTASLIEKIYRGGRGLLWQARYGFPARQLRVIAITGTNGKSTTSALINEVLKAAGYKTAMMTTPMLEIAGQSQLRTTTRTLEKQSEVQSFFSRAKKADIDWVVLEVPSHALDQGRIMGVKVEVAVITNLTPEHLDYHLTMEEYARVKARLLRSYGAKWAILNHDDKWYEFFRNDSLATVVSVGKSKAAAVQISSVKQASQGSEAKLSYQSKTVNLKTKLLGEFNLYNAAQATAVGLVLGLQAKTIEQGIVKLKAVPGRLEPIDCGQKFKVLIDYAVTADAIANVLISLKKVTKGKVRIVFGATGDRDKTKRPAMGEAAGKYADFVYLTDDETYSEDPKAIIDAVYGGIKKVKATKKTKIITERGEAIRRALTDAQPGDTVLITGLGHETSRNIGGKLIPWRDQDIAQQGLNQIK